MTTQQLNPKDLTPEQREALEELSADLEDSGYEELDIPPQVLQLFAVPGIKEKLLQRIAADPACLHLGYYFANLDMAREQSRDVDNPPCEVLAPLPDCGTVACIAGHIAQLSGGDPSLDLEAHWRWQSGRVLWEGVSWSTQDFAYLVWRATYPDGDLGLFLDGTTDPAYICNTYGEWDDYSERKLTLPLLQRFLEDASKPPKEVANED